MLFLGIDWGEHHHDLCLLNQDGAVLAVRRITDGGLAGVEELHVLMAAHAEAPTQVAVGIETDRGLLVGALLAAGYQVYAVNPHVVSRYRGRHGTSRAKSDRSDAKVLADLVRTDRHKGGGAGGCNPPAILAILLVRGPVVPVGQGCREVKARGERSWPSVGSPPKAAPEANLFRRSA